MFAMARRLGLPLLSVCVAIAAPAAAQVKQRDAIRGWTISQEYRNGHFYQCIAETTGSGNSGLRLSFMANFDRHLSLDVAPGKSGTTDTVTLVMRPSGTVFQMDMVRRADGRLWAPRPLTNAVTDSIDLSKALDVDVASDHSRRTYELGDTSTMFAAVDGCLTQNSKH